MERRLEELAEKLCILCDFLKEFVEQLREIYKPWSENSEHRRMQELYHRRQAKLEYYRQNYEGKIFRNDAAEDEID